MQKIQNKFNISLRYSALIFFVLALSSLSFLSCTSTQVQSTKSDSSNQATLPELISKHDHEISIMSFNVENLFDAKHDQDREDYTYLPLEQKNTAEIKKFCSEMKNKTYKEECFSLDWNENLVKFKLGQVAQVIRQIDQGKGPDNLFLIEVENESILKRLVQDELKDLGYQTIVLIEGPDLRGIDPGFISKFPLVGKPKLHLVPYSESDPEKLKWAQRSRGILEVTVKALNNKDITFLVGHFPSQSNPVSWRAQAIQFAKNLMAEHIKQGRAVVFGGDLNITDEEEQKYQFFKTEMSQVGQVSHLVSTSQYPGTHYYRGEWSHLDVLVFSNNLKQVGFELIPESIQVVKTPVHMKKNGTPLRFSSEKKEGVSDHFPLYTRLRYFDKK